MVLAPGSARLLTPFAALALQACSINAHGTSHSQTLLTDGAAVHVLTAPGVHIATLPTGVHLSLGHYREVLVFPRPCMATTTDPPSRDRLMRSGPPEAWVTDAVGLSLRGGRHEAGLTLGRRHAAVLAHIPPGASLARQLDLDLRDPARTVLRRFDQTPCSEESEAP